MASFFKRKNREPSISSMGSSETRGSTDTHKHRDRVLPNYFGEDAPERAGSSFLHRLKDMKSRWSDIMNVDDLLQAELADARLHPEIQWAASIRRSNDLCDAEAALVKARRKKAVKQLKRFLKLPDDEEVDERDVPIVCLGGSGGGFRAMLGFLGTMEAAKEAGMWDLIMYTGGVSGSCWALGAYYTWGEMSTKRALSHFAKHSMHHPLSPKAMRETMKSPRGPYFLLAPLQKKQLAGLSQTLMDVYGSFVTAYLWLPSKEEAINIWKDRMPSLHREWFRWSSVAPKISKGEEPMPLLTAIRHERPWKAWKDKDSPFEKEDHNDKEHRLAMDAWWQWSEFSPFEFGCDELKYWIPIWGFGRPFEGGVSTKSLPEHSLSSILGLCTSAPAAPMSIYLGTIQRGLPKGWIEGSIDNISGAIAHLWGQHDTKVFEGRHPVHAANEHNPLYHASPSPRPPGIENAKRIHMLDSGISNNCPTYAFLHPSRGADVVINFDASSDVMSEAAPARNQEMGDMKGLTFTKRAHPFPVPTTFQPPQSQSHPSETTFASSVSVSAPETPDGSESNVPSTPTPKNNPSDGLPIPSSSSRAPSFAPSSLRQSSLFSEHRPQNSSNQDGGTGEPSNSDPKKRAFEKAREEDVKRKAKAQAKGWTPQSIEKEFGGRYAQIFDGIPTHPIQPFASEPETSNDGSAAPPPMSGDQKPGSIPYNVSDHNVPLATRPVSLVYMPLFPNKVNPGYDPTSDSFSGSYNLKWTEEQVQTIRKTSKANFLEGLDVIRLAIREGYERRKAERLSHSERKKSREQSASASASGSSWNAQGGSEAESKQSEGTATPTEGGEVLSNGNGNGSGHEGAAEGEVVALGAVIASNGDEKTKEEVSVLEKKKEEQLELKQII